MKVKIWLPFVMGAVLGVLLCTLVAIVFVGHKIRQTLQLNQDMQIEEWERLSWEAYTNGQPEVSVWALNNYLNKVENVYGTRYEKGKTYYFLMFKGQARLAQVYGQLHDHISETNELNLAISSMQRWSSQERPNKEAVLDTIVKINAEE
jgi:hypothetical protein